MLLWPVEHTQAGPLPLNFILKFIRVWLVFSKEEKKMRQKLKVQKEVRKKIRMAETVFKDIFQKLFLYWWF